MTTRLPGAGGTPAFTLADLESVMRELDEHIDEAIALVPARHRPLVPNALLNVAVERLLAERGTEATVSVLRRLAELIASGVQPEPGRVIPLHRADA